MQRFDYSLLGDPVNLASRLESLGKVYGIDVIIGEETAARLDERRTDRGRCRRGQGQDSGQPHLYDPAGTDRRAGSAAAASGIAGRLSASGMEHGVGLAEQRQSGRAAVPCPGIRSLQAADRAIPDRAAAGELGWRVRAPGEMTAPDRALRGPATVFYASREMTVLPITSISILVRRKQSSASSGRQTIGSFSLNDVLSTSGIPVRSRNASIKR